MSPGYTEPISRKRTAKVHIERGEGVCWRIAFESEAMPGTLAAFAGVLSLAGLDIVTANVRLSLDDLRVTDTFEVAPITRFDFSAANAEELSVMAESALSGSVDLAVLLRENGISRGGAHVGAAVPVEVETDLDSEITTGIRVRAADRPGLLFDIATVLSAYGLRTRALAVLTIGGVARDMFRVVDADGRPPRDAQKMNILRTELTRVCG